MASHFTNPYAPRPGCPLCSIVATPPPTDGLPLFRNTGASHGNGYNGGGSSNAEIVWRDDNVTAYIEKNHPVSSKGHVIIILNLHVPSIYSLSSTDLPLLIHIQTLANRLLHTLNPLRPLSPNPPASPNPAFQSSPLTPVDPALPFRVGFISPPFRDNKIPVTDHLHAHAFSGPPDLAGWWRGIAYGPLAWYAIDDLIAEIRESTSNNRIKSAYPNRVAPIDRVPTAGNRSGNADGVEASLLPIPLHVNKTNMSPAPTPRHSRVIDDVALGHSGSVDLGTRKFNPSKDKSRESSSSSGGALRLNTSKARDPELGTIELIETEGEAGPGPSTTSRRLTMTFAADGVS